MSDWGEERNHLLLSVVVRSLITHPFQNGAQSRWAVCVEFQTVVERTVTPAEKTRRLFMQQTANQQMGENVRLLLVERMFIQHPREEAQSPLDEALKV